MGTQLFEAGLSSGDPPEAWNVERPDAIQAVHRSYLQAGADLVLTNSFGGNRFRLELHSLEHRVGELNQAAARNARIAADEETERTGRPVLCSGINGTYRLVAGTAGRYERVDVRSRVRRTGRRFG